MLNCYRIGLAENMGNEDYIKKWLQGTLNEEERGIFEKTEEYKSLAKLSKSLDSFKAPAYDVKAEYDLLRPRLSSKGQVVAVNWLGPILKIAAILIVAAGGYLLFFYKSLTVVETLAASKAELVLPDSSLVVLNASSRLSFYKKNWKKERKVQLEGEALFRVAKGSRFDVETSSGVVRVLGTVFNVKDRKDYFEVICYEGSVEVQSTQEVVKLFPNQMFKVIGGIISKDSIATDNVLGWKANESSFKSVPFLYVIQELERQYNVSVLTRNVDTDQLFTGKFTHSDLSLALKSVIIPLDLTFEIPEDKKIVITGDIK